MSTRIIVDANVLLSALIGKTTAWYFDRLLTARALDSVQLYHTGRLITEVQASIQKPKLRKLIDSKKAVSFLKNFESVSSHIAINPTVLSSASRDPKDNYLLVLSEQADADYLITGDKDLLVLKHYLSTQIVSFAEFNTAFFGG